MSEPDRTGLALGRDPLQWWPTGRSGGSEPGWDLIGRVLVARQGAPNVLLARSR